MKKYTNKELESGNISWDLERVIKTVESCDSEMLCDLIDLVPVEFLPKITWKAKSLSYNSESRLVERLNPEQLLNYSNKYTYIAEQIGRRLPVEELPAFIKRQSHSGVLDHIGEWVPSEVLPIVVERLRYWDYTGEPLTRFFKRFPTSKALLEWFFDGHTDFYNPAINRLNRIDPTALKSFTSLADIARRTVVHHCTNQEVLFEFRNDTCEKVREIVARKLSEDSLVHLVGDSSENVRLEVAHRLPTEQLHRMAADSSVKVRKVVVNRIPTEYLKPMLNDRSKKVREVALARSGGSVVINASTRTFKNFSKIRKWESVTPAMLVASYRKAIEELKENDEAYASDYYLYREDIPDNLYTRGVFIEAVLYGRFFDRFPCDEVRARDTEMIRKDPSLLDEVMVKSSSLRLRDIPIEMRTEDIVDRAINNNLVSSVGSIPVEFQTKEKICSLAKVNYSYGDYLVKNFDALDYVDLYQGNHKLLQYFPREIQEALKIMDDNPELSLDQCLNTYTQRVSEEKSLQQREFLYGVKKVTYGMGEPVHICMSCVEFNAVEKKLIPVLMEESYEEKCWECSKTIE